MSLRATLYPADANYIQQQSLILFKQHQRSIPKLMSLQVPINPYLDDIIEGWRRQDVANRQSSTQAPTPKKDECPVCLVDAATYVTTCNHKFCENCLDICARAHPRTALLCPLCRKPLQAPLILEEMDDPEEPPPGFTAVPLNRGQTYFSGGRPRVNEVWLNEEDLNIYLGYYVPILSNP